MERIHGSADEWNGVSLNGDWSGPLPLMITAAQFSSILGVSTRQVRRLVDEGRCPQPVRLKRSPRWPRAVVEEWMANGCPAFRSRSGRRK